jgi:hypothetical protein
MSKALSNRGPRNGQRDDGPWWLAYGGLIFFFFHHFRSAGTYHHNAHHSRACPPNLETRISRFCLGRWRLPSSGISPAAAPNNAIILTVHIPTPSSCSSLIAPILGPVSLPQTKRIDVRSVHGERAHKGPHGIRQPSIFIPCWLQIRCYPHANRNHAAAGRSKWGKQDSKACNPVVQQSIAQLID